MERGKGTKFKVTVEHFQRRLRREDHEMPNVAAVFPNRFGAPLLHSAVAGPRRYARNQPEFSNNNVVNCR